MHTVLENVAPRLPVPQNLTLAPFSVPFLQREPNRLQTKTIDSPSGSQGQGTLLSLAASLICYCDNNKVPSIQLRRKRHHYLYAFRQLS